MQEDGAGVREGLAQAASAQLRYVDLQHEDLAKAADPSVVSWGRDVDVHTQWASWTCTTGWAVETVAANYADLTAVARGPGGQFFATTDQ